MEKIPFEIIEMICNECHNISSFPHSKKNKIQIFTTQGSYCYQCKQNTTHFIINDRNYAYNLLKEKQILSEREEYILHLIEKNINTSKVMKKK